MKKNNKKEEIVNGIIDTEKKISRNQFIEEVKKGFTFMVGTSIFGVFLNQLDASTGKPAAKKVVLNGDYDPYAHNWAYLIDINKCIGCGMCVRGCKKENNVPDGCFRTWIERYFIEEGKPTQIDSPNGGLDGFKPLHKTNDQSRAYFVPKMCNHCDHSPCNQVCPVGAAFKTPDGVVLVDEKHCVGCGYCIQACPYGSRFILPGPHVASKCTWCYHRITRGGKPACVQACPTGTRMFGDLSDPNDPLRKRLAKERVQVLKPDLLTYPQVSYLGLDKEVR